MRKLNLYRVCVEHRVAHRSLFPNGEERKQSEVVLVSPMRLTDGTFPALCLTAAKAILGAGATWNDGWEWEVKSIEIIGTAFYVAETSQHTAGK